MQSSVDLSLYAPDFQILLDTPAQGDRLQVLEAIRHASISVQINEEIGKIADFRLVLADQFDVSKQQFVWLDSPILFPIKKTMLMKINMGYALRSSGLQELIQAEVNSLSTSGFTSEIPQLTIQGYHKGHSLLTEESSGDKPIKIHKNDTYSIIAENLADAAGLKKSITPVGMNKSINVIDKTSLYCPGTAIAKKPTVYNDFLRDAAKRVGYEFFVARNTLFFLDPRTDKGLGTMTLEWGKDLLEFSPTINTAQLVPRVEVRGHAAPSKTNITGIAKAGDEDVLEKGKKTASQLAVEIGKKKLDIKDRILCSKQEADDMAKAQLNSISDNLITGSGSMVGTPDLIPGQLLELKGVGERFSGKYFVTAVTNTIDGSGYKTTFKVRKNVI